MNNNKGTPQRRPAPQAQNRPTGASRPAQRPAPQNRAPQPSKRPPVQTPMSRKRKRGVSNGTLALILAILSVILVALIITFIVIKANDNDNNEKDGGNNDPFTESTPEGSVDVGANLPLNPNYPNWKPQISDPKAFVPVTDSSTVKLSANKIYSNQIIMVDTKTGKSVCEYGADTKIYPASMTKIMTVVVACDLIEDMDDTFVLTKELLYTIESGATNAYFIADNPIPMVDLIYGAILPSGADACLGLANALAGSEAEFVKLMNAKAAELGCTKTNFTNSIGLHDENHYSSVRDIATILGYAMENPFLRKVMTSTSYKTVAPVDRADGTLYASWQSPYHSSKATVIGAKSGYTTEAGRCLASVSKTESGHEYIIVSAGAFYEEGENYDAKSQSFIDIKTLCDTYIK